MDYDRWKSNSSNIFDDIRIEIMNLKWCFNENHDTNLLLGLDLIESTGYHFLLVANGVDGGVKCIKKEGFRFCDGFQRCNFISVLEVLLNDITHSVHGTEWCKRVALRELGKIKLFWAFL